MKPLKDLLTENKTQMLASSPETVKLLKLMAGTGLFTAVERHYSFAQVIYERGRWYDENGNAEPPGTAYLAVVLDKRIEVSIGESWGKNGGDVFYRPNALVRPGGLFGTFEICDALNHTLSVQNYTVFSGTRTFYFAEPVLDPAVTEGTNSSKQLANKLVAAGYDSSLNGWDTPSEHAPSNKGLGLMKILSAAAIAGWKSHVLLIPITKSLLTNAVGNDVTRLISQVAWQQSAHLRVAGIEGYSRSELTKALRGDKAAFPELNRADYVRELAAMRQCLLGMRPGFREVKVTKENDKELIKQLEQSGPFTGFYTALNKALKKATLNKGKDKWKRSTNTQAHVHIPDYLYWASGKLVYPLWMHAVPFLPGKQGWAAHSKCVNLLISRKAGLDEALFANDPAYASTRYVIKNCGGKKEPLHLRGHAVISPLVTNLPILSQTVVQNKNEKVVGIVAVQHLMEETLILFNELIQRGIADSKTITVIGKPYSSSSEIAMRFQQLGMNVVIPDGNWNRGRFTEWFEGKINEAFATALSGLGAGTGKVLLLDDGGELIKAASLLKNSKYKFAAVEQTTRGVASAIDVKYPVVLVAASALKSLIEPEFVARAAVGKLARYHPEVLHTKKVGIIGLGNVGGYLAKYLLQRHDIHFTELQIYDDDKDKVKAVVDFAKRLFDARTGTTNPVLTQSRNIEEVIKSSDVVYGCTGKDLGKDLKVSNPNQMLISLSSNDIEFSSILIQATPEMGRHLDTLAVSKMKIIAGGFPVTFDRDVASAPLVEMQLTRALLLAGIEQAISTTVSGTVMLDSDTQWKIWEHWQKETHTVKDDPGAKTWKAARDTELLGELDDLKTQIGTQADWNKKNEACYKEALEKAKK